MPHVKIPKKSTAVDMTAMCDVSFLLLTFFILTSKFKPTEPVAIDLPNSRSEITVTDAIKIAVDKDGKSYLNFPSSSFRQTTIKNLTKYYKDKYPYLATLSDKQIANFGQVETFGVDARALPDLLNRKADDVSKASTSGIPMDTLDNQLGDWVMAARYADPKMRIAIKGDKNSDVKAIQRVIKILTEKDIHTFNLITTLSGASKRAQ
jgi:biopolymer transport protein ExbD